MTRTWRKVTAITVLLLPLACTQTPGPPVIDPTTLREIHIQYKWQGMGAYAESFVIHPTDDGRAFSMQSYIYTNYWEGKGVLKTSTPTPESIKALIEAANAPAWTKQQAVEAVVDKLQKARRRQNADEILTPDAECEFNATLRQPRLDDRPEEQTSSLDAYYREGIGWTDDYPVVRVSISLSDQRAYAFSSESQKAGMLPWQMGLGGPKNSATETSWSLPISRALAGVLPEDSRMRSRLLLHCKPRPD